jgi:hypothetical protein
MKKSNMLGTVGAVALSVLVVALPLRAVSAPVFYVHAAPDPSLFFPPYTVTLNGTFDVSAGNIYNPSLKVNVYPGEAFSSETSLTQLASLYPEQSLYEAVFGGAADNNLILQLVFTTPTSTDLSGFTGGEVHGFAVLDSSCPSCGFAVGSIYAIGSITAVPEPSSWALMIVAIGGLGLARRTKRSADRELDAT